MRVLGVDPGRKRVGLACSDPRGVLASPLETIEVGDDLVAAASAVARVALALGAETVVVGLPLSLDGSENESTARARRLAERIGECSGLRVELYDERFTTELAGRMIGESSGRRKPRPVDRKSGRLDAASAAVMLQGWLDLAAGAGRNGAGGRKASG